MKKTTYSIILPIYNQEDHIEILINTYSNALKKLPDTWELLLIINGSHDNSFLMAKKYAQNKELVSVYNLKKQGWGSAIKYGFSIAKGDYICYTNSARTNIHELMMMLPYIKVNDACIIKAQRIVRENIIRRIGSVMYSLENALLFNIPMLDVNGTPTIIPKNIFSQLLPISDDTMFDLELMIRCFHQKIPVVRFPIMHTKRINGKSTTTFTAALKMYFKVFNLKKRMQV